MKTITPGHRYELSNFENTESTQVIQFIEKTPSETDPTKLQTVNDGTTNEEVLSVLIDRLTFLNQSLPSRETAIVITKLEESLMWLEKRTKDRLKRSVEGTHKA